MNFLLLNVAFAVSLSTFGSLKERGSLVSFGSLELIGSLRLEVRQ